MVSVAWVTAVALAAVVAIPESQVERQVDTTAVVGSAAVARVMVEVVTAVGAMGVEETEAEDPEVVARAAVARASAVEVLEAAALVAVAQAEVA